MTFSDDRHFTERAKGQLPASTAIVRIRVLLGAGVLLGACLGSVFTLLAAIQDKYGFGDAQLGLIAGSAFFASLIASLLVGPIADAGHERAVVIGALTCTAVGMIGFAASGSLVGFVVSRAIAGAGLGAFDPAARRMLVTFAPQRAAEMLGRLGSYIMGGVLIGPAVAAPLAERWGVSAPFAFFAVLSVLGLVVAGGVLLRGKATVDGDLDDPDRGRPDPERVAWSSAWKVLAQPGVGGAALLSFAIFLPVGIYDSLWSRYLTNLGATGTFIGFSLLFFGVPVIVLAARAGRWVDASGPIRIANIGAATVILFTAAYGLARSPWHVAGMAIIEGTGQAMLTPAIAALMVAVCPRDQLSTGQGISAALSQIGAGIGALFAPAFFARMGAGPMFFAAAGAMAVLWVVGVLWARAGLARSVAGAAADPSAS